MKKLFRIWLLTRLFTLITFAGAAQTDLNTLDNATASAAEEAFFCQVLPKGAIPQNVLDSSVAANEPGKTVRFAVITGNKLVPASDVYTLNQGDAACRYLGILWAVQTTEGKFFLATEETNSTNNSSLNSSVENQKKEIYRILDSTTKANNDALMKLNQQNEDLLKKNADLQKTINSDGNSNSTTHVQPPRSNNGDQDQNAEVVDYDNSNSIGSYPSLFSGTGTRSRNQPYPYRGFKPMKRRF